MRRFVIVVSLSLAAFSAGIFAYGQIIPDIVSLDTKPASPSPRDTFTVTARTPTFDKNQANFVWTVDGKTKDDLSGIGKNSITLTAGENGSVTRINVGVSGPNISGAKASSLIRVSDLALSWYASTYVPKWFKGKALPIENSEVTIVALPRIILGGSVLKPENLIYHWTMDDKPDVLSGVGKQIFRMKTSNIQGGSYHIKVEIEDISKQIKKEKELFIVPTIPKIGIYAMSPLGGIEFRSTPFLLDASAGNLFDFVAEPFYFPLQSKRDLSFKWSVGGQEVAGGAAEPYRLSINAGEGGGALTLSILVSGLDIFIPGASKTLTLLLR